MNLILERFNQMLEDPTPINKFEFNDFLFEQTSQTEILEASQQLMIYEPSHKVLKAIYESANQLGSEFIKEEIKKIKDVKEELRASTRTKTLTESLTDLQEVLENVYNVTNSEEYLIETTINHFQNREYKFKEKLQAQVTLESYTPDALFFNTAKATLESTFAKLFVSLSKSTNDSEFLHTMESLMKIATEYDSLHEDYLIYEAGGNLNDKAKKAAVKVDDKARKVANGMRKKGSEAGRVGMIAKKSTERFTNLVHKTIDNIRDMDDKAKREAVIRGGLSRKVIKLLNMAVITGALALFSPIAAGISLIVAVVLDKRTEKRVKDSLITDLENELRVIKEKVRDADAQNDKHAKYRLMRLESLVEKEIYRVKTNNRNIKKLDYKELKK